MQTDCDSGLQKSSPSHQVCHFMTVKLLSFSVSETFESEFYQGQNCIKISFQFLAYDANFVITGFYIPYDVSE